MCEGSSLYFGYALGQLADKHLAWLHVDEQTASVYIH